MVKRSHYVAFKRMQDKYIAIDKNNCITCWSTISGKVNSFKEITEFDFSQDYEIQSDFYERGYYDKVLLVRKEEKEGFDESAFFEKNGFQFNAQLPGQVTFNKALGKTFHEYMLIEIDHSTDVKVHFKFYHPKYNTEQMLLFNEDNEIMLEMIKGNYAYKVILYEKNRTYGEFVDWNIIRQLENFPDELK